MRSRGLRPARNRPPGRAGSGVRPGHRRGRWTARPARHAECAVAQERVLNRRSVRGALLGRRTSSDCERNHEGGVIGVVAFVGSFVLAIAMVAAVYWYAQRRPIGAPLTWGDAM